MRKEPYITGMVIHYYMVCRTKAWLTMKGISTEKGIDAIEAGKRYAQRSMTKSKSAMKNGSKVIPEVSLPGIKIDKLDLTNKIVIEEKSSDKNVRISKYQLSYYMKGFDGWTGEVRGKKKTYKVDKPIDLNEIENEISDLYNSPCPDPVRIKLCDKCSYQRLCFS